MAVAPRVAPTATASQGMDREQRGRWADPAGLDPIGGRPPCKVQRPGMPAEVRDERHRGRYPVASYEVRNPGPTWHHRCLTMGQARQAQIDPGRWNCRGAGSTQTLREG